MITPVTIKLDKERTIRLSFKALRAVEKHFGKPLAKMDWQNLSIVDMVTVLTIGLQHEDKDLTTEKVFDILDECGADLLTVGEALGRAIGGDKKDDEGNAERAAGI